MLSQWEFGSVHIFCSHSSMSEDSQIKKIEEIFHYDENMEIQNILLYF